MITFIRNFFSVIYWWEWGIVAVGIVLIVVLGFIFKKIESLFAQDRENQGKHFKERVTGIKHNAEKIKKLKEQYEKARSADREKIAQEIKWAEERKQFWVKSEFKDNYSTINKYQNTSKVLIGFLLIICVGTLINIYDIYSNLTLRKLEHRYTDLQSLQAKLSSKEGAVEHLKWQYSQNINFYQDEIRKIKENRQINSFNEAIGDRDIAYDLSIIQREQAYIGKLTEIETSLNAGISELFYLKRMTQDDYILAEVLNEKEVEGLVKEIDRVIEVYLPQSNELVIEVDDKYIESLEEIWKKI